MRYIKLAILGCSIMGLGLNGCSSLAISPQAPAIQVYKLQQGCPDNLIIAPGQTIQLLAEDNPSTGYSWKLAAHLNHVEATSSYKANKSEGYLVVGSGGTRQFNFKGISPGTDDIHLVYTRSWEPSQIGAQWRCKVTVE